MSVIGTLKRSEKGNIFTWVLSRDVSSLLNIDIVRSNELCVNVDQKFNLEFHKGKIWISGSNTYNVWRLILRSSAQNPPLICKYKISIIEHDKIIDNRTEYCTFSTNRSETLILRKTQTEIQRMINSKNDIHVVCELSVSLEGQKNLLNYDSDKTNEVLKLNFNWVFLDEGLSDVKLRTACGKEIPAHRLMLATASPVFKAMFTHDMMENQNKLVEMTDVSHEATVEMLRYIYTGSVGNNETSLTINLLAAAEKYQLEDLKNKCGQILSSNLSNENALEMLKISDTYNADYLKKETVDFIKGHINELSDFHEISNMILGKAPLVVEQCEN
ncbi:protein roadkill-like isoform X1 [Trichogramma pretiosum]|uniref:protein roadkill-like isoform X1 n=2 Tax=Trichogramma pretiosum TaxID=7493 RepID=UPI000C71BD2C|nr:protein roadkill-like isoform X1 [Trichogramma pretiosum]